MRGRSSCATCTSTELRSDAVPDAPPGRSAAGLQPDGGLQPTPAYSPTAAYSPNTSAISLDVPTWAKTNSMHDSAASCLAGELPATQSLATKHR